MASGVIQSGERSEENVNREMRRDWVESMEAVLKVRRDKRKELKGNLAAQIPGLGTSPPERYCSDLSDREV